MSEDGTDNVDNLKIQIAPGGGNPTSRIGYLFGNFGNSDYGFLIGNLRNAPLRFGVGPGPTERMRITPGGNVGIGITNPTEKLDVDGTARLRSMPCGGGTNVVVNSSGVLMRESSSKRYKKDIRPIEVNADRIFQLQPVRFEWKTTGEEDIGLIAEEVKEIIPDLVIYDKEGKADAVKYDKIVLYLLEVVKAQQQKILALEQRK
jgi:hypothetical protein